MGSGLDPPANNKHRHISPLFISLVIKVHIVRLHGSPLFSHFDFDIGLIGAEVDVWGLICICTLLLVFARKVFDVFPG